MLSYILSFKSLVSRNQAISMDSNKIKTLTEESIDGMFENEHLVISAKANIAIMNYLKEKIVEIEKQIRKVTQIKPEHDFLITVPGIGKSLVLTVMLETGDINRFKAVGNYASYCRCVSSKRLSNLPVRSSRRQATRAKERTTAKTAISIWLGLMWK